MNLKNVSIPVVITISLVLLLNAGSSNIYGQIIGQTNQTNQTSGQNTTQQVQQQLQQSNQTQQQQSNKTQ
jgi:acetate kinase